jgi:hypothetical protein
MSPAAAALRQQLREPPMPQTAYSNLQLERGPRPCILDMRKDWESGVGCESIVCLSLIDIIINRQARISKPADLAAVRERGRQRRPMLRPASQNPARFPRTNRGPGLGSTTAAVALALSHGRALRQQPRQQPGQGPVCGIGCCRATAAVTTPRDSSQYSKPAAIATAIARLLECCGATAAIAYDGPHCLP